MFQDSPPDLSAAAAAPLPTSLLFVLAFGIAAVAALFAGAVTSPRHAVVGLVMVGLACAVVTRRGSGLRAALVVVPVFWLFYDGFVEHRDGTLGWAGWTDAWRLAALVAMAALPALVRAAVGLWTARSRFRRASLESFEPEMPSRRHPSAWN
ncbi:hypothetical protein [Streptacidiphilus sp. MAP5-3]|uniref:hypothetical protein n=1 Tax=unclassified Streptacidiphilus TaxID=2643834 RepID=UPI003516566B